MILSCPDKKSLEWKQLVSHLGSEKKAMAAYYANGSEIPSIDQLEKKGKIKEEAPRFQRLIDNLQRQVQIIDKEIIGVRTRMSDLSKGKNEKAKREAYLKFQELEKEKDILIKQAIEVKKLDSIDRIIPIAEEQIQQANNILQKETLTGADLMRVHSIADIWSKSTSIDGGETFFFTEEEIQAIREGDEVFKERLDKLNFIRTLAEDLNSRWLQVSNIHLNMMGIEKFGDSFYYDFKQTYKDAGMAKKLFMSISDSDNELHQLLFRLVKDANTEAGLEGDVIVKQIDEMFKDYKSKNYDEFAQEFTDGRKTGNLVSRFSYKFYEESKLLKDKLDKVLLNIEETDSPAKTKIELKSKAYKDYAKKLKDRSIIFDARLLFPEDEIETEAAKAHKKLIKDTLGEKGYKDFMERFKGKIEAFKEQSEAIKERLQAEYGEEWFREYEHWDAENNPYKLSERLIDGKGDSKVNGEVVKPNYFFTISIPKKTIDGKDTGYYDKKFETIEADDKKLNIYKFIIKTNSKLNKYLGDEISGVTPYTIPTLEKSIIEHYMQGGMSKAAGSAYEKFRSEYIESVNNEFIPGSNVTASDREILQLRAKFISDNRGRILDYVRLRQIQYENTHNESPSPEMMASWKRDIIAEIASEQSFDLPTILKLYALSATNYKYMSKVEFAMSIINEMNRQARQTQLNSYDQDKVSDFSRVLRDANGSVAWVEDFLKHHMNIGTRAKEGVSKNKTYTKKEQRQLDEIDNEIKTLQDRLVEKKITESEFLEKFEALNNQKSKIGGYFKASGIGDKFLKFYQLLGMGWNGFAGFINVGVGQISNYIEASGGQRFTVEELNKAETLVMNSILKGTTMEIINTPMARKIRALMEKYQVLKETSNDIYDQRRLGKYIGGKKAKYLMPYTIQAMTEYVNQAPVMISMLMHTKVKDSNGNEISLWDAYNDDGTLKEGIEFNDTEENRNDYLTQKSKIDSAIVWIHGNYDADRKVMYKNRILGRALMMFRGWLPMAITSRFGKEINDLQGGIVRKGRWISYKDYYQSMGAVKGSTTIVKSLLMKLAGMPLINKITRVNNQQLFDDLISEEFTEVDAANMRRNLQALLMYGSMMILTLLIKANMDDADDEDKALCYFWINQINRMQSDMSFFIDPTEFVKLNKSVVPAFQLVTNFERALESSTNVLFGADDEYQQGPYKGQSKQFIAWGRVVPGMNQLPRFSSITEQLYDKNTITSMVTDDEE